MKMQIILGITQMSLLVGIVSCGTDNNAGVTKGMCNSEVLTGYRAINSSCSSMRSRADIDDCENKILQFQARYPSLNCSALAEDESGEYKVQLNNAHINQLLEEAQNL